MTKGNLQVKEFMQGFSQNCPDKPVQLDEETAKLRAKLILEEAFETITKGLGLEIAITASDPDFVYINDGNLNYIGVSFTKVKEVDLVELCDGLADLAYVGEFGTAVAVGVDLEPIQDEVHRSNMGKFWSTEEIQGMNEEEIANYTVIDVGNGNYIVKRADGKIIKSPSFTSPKIAEIIQAQLDK